MVGITNHAKRVAAKYVENTPRISDGLLDATCWDEYESRLLDNLFARTGLVAPIRSFAPDRLEIERPEELVIACISSRIPIAEELTPGLRPAKFRDECRLVQLDDATIAKDWISDREREFEAALRQDPHIICFNELAFPPPPPAPDSGWSVDTIRDYANRRIKFEEAIRLKLSEANSKAFVFLGSFHCLMTLYNVGVLFPWGPSSDGVTLRVMHEWLDDDHEALPIEVKPPVTLKKRFPARRAGEVTRTPPEPSFDVFETEFGRFAVLICSDILDLNQFMNIARWNEPAEKFFGIDVVLVPSFNKSNKLLSMCRELSYIASTTVVCTNANPKDSSYPDTQAFCCGLSASELKQTKGLKRVISSKSHAGKRAGGTGARLQIYKLRRAQSGALRGSTQDLLMDTTRPGWHRSSLTLKRSKLE